MATARAEQVDLSVTPFYHCMTRCVRRAFLCGDDRYSGKNFDHRKLWVRDRLRDLAALFAMDICAYAVMSNHLHVVLHVNEELAATWSDDEVAKRYIGLYPMATEAWGHKLLAVDRRKLAATWRERLTSISWLMRALSEFIARKANKEDGTRGRFWEGRFKSQAILDEQGLLTCMAYVDLNPIRAGLCDSLSGSDFTSIQDRLKSLAESSSNQGSRKPATPNAGALPRLAPMHDSKTDKRRPYKLPVSMKGYLGLLRWTAGLMSDSDSGNNDSGKQETSFDALSAKNTCPAPLTEQGINREGWLAAMQGHALAQTPFLGSAASMKRHAEKRKCKWLRGIGLARQMAG